MWTLHLVDEAATVAAGKTLGSHLQAGAIVYLQGTLGAGKTTFCRGVLNAFGYSGAVKSPTYTLVEPYEFPQIQIFHFDLYRLGDAEELEFMGIRDYFSDNNCCLVEWPERGDGYISAPDLIVELIPVGRQRNLRVEPKTTRGEQILAKLKETAGNV